MTPGIPTALAAAALAGCALLRTLGSTEAALPFIEDDYARALAEARARDVPLVVEAWAPW